MISRNIGDNVSFNYYILHRTSRQLSPIQNWWFTHATSCNIIMETRTMFSKARFLDKDYQRSL